MFRRGRAVVPNFKPSEQLYRRFRRQDIVNGELTPAALRFPAQTGHSVNRSRFSRPEDVLWVEANKLEGFGIFQIAVAVIPGELVCRETGRRFTFFPKHAPHEDNYAHSEIWCDNIPPQNAGCVVPTKIVKKEFKARISRNLQVIKAAEI